MKKLLTYQQFLTERYEINESYSDEDINMSYGFYGTIEDSGNIKLAKKARKLFDAGIAQLKSAPYRLTQDEALAVLNSVMGRKAADQIIDGQADSAVLGLEQYYTKNLKKEIAKIQRLAVTEELILEGGAAGHMKHPFERMDLTFDDFRKIIEYGLKGELNFEVEATEKTDGQNLFATVKDGEVLFARNKGTMIHPAPTKKMLEEFEEHDVETVKQTFTKAIKDLDSALSKLPQSELEVFGNGKNFLNMELMYSGNPNVIHYDRDVIQFHGIIDTDGEGNHIGHQNVAGKLVKILKDLKADVGETFTFIPPQILKLGKDINFEENKQKFISKINDLQSKYNLNNNDEVMKYHEKFWRGEIEENFPELDDITKEGLFLRLAYDDKKTLNLRSLEKTVGKDLSTKIKAYDKQKGKAWKKNIRPFEDLFLELGSIILKNASNFVAANPDAEMQRLHSQIRKESEAIKKVGTEQQILKVTSELERLERIGGIESIIPTEGLVFRYKGKDIKLTGTFAAINQLMGIIKYGR